MTTERRWWKDRSRGTLRRDEPGGRDQEWVWVDVEDPDEQSLRRLADRYQLDELALEDALDADLFPRFEDYGDFVAVALRSISTSEGEVRTTPLLCLLGRDFLVTLHHEPLPGLEFVVETALTHERTAEGGPDRMLARLADVGSRQFEPVVEEIDEILAACELQAIDGLPGAIVPLHTIRRQITALRSVMRPQRSVLQSLTYADTPLVGERSRRRFTDVLERHARLMEALEAARATAGGVIDVHRGAVAEKTNEIMKVLTIFSATLLPMTLIAGIYGMNFSDMPELDSRYGYPITLGVMAIVGILMWRYFTRRGFIGTPRVAHLTVAIAARLATAATQPVRTVGSLVAGGLRVLTPDQERPGSDESEGEPEAPASDGSDL